MLVELFLKLKMCVLSDFQVTKLNYRVYVAGEPEIAEEILEQRGTIDLLLTDVIMPRTNGLDLYANLVQRCPSLKKIFMSGYTNRIITERGCQPLNAPFLQKPFSVDSIAELVRKVLDGK